MKNNKELGIRTGGKHKGDSTSRSMYYGLFKSHCHMIGRCHDEKHKSHETYGAKGVTVCNEWLNAQNFINDMFPSFIEGLTLDRKESSDNYNKENCRWSDKTTQARNIKTDRKNNISGYKGVSILRNKYQASISLNGKSIYLGVFNNSIDAAKAYDNYIINNNLEHTKNF